MIIAIFGGYGLQLVGKGLVHDKMRNTLDGAILGHLLASMSALLLFMSKDIFSRWRYEQKDSKLLIKFLR